MGTVRLDDEVQKKAEDFLEKQETIEFASLSHLVSAATQKLLKEKRVKEDEIIEEKRTIQDL